MSEQTKIEDVKNGDSFKVRTIKEIADMSVTQFDIFHEDLKAWFQYHKKLDEGNKLFGKKVIIHIKINQKDSQYISGATLISRSGEMLRNQTATWRF